MSPLMLIVLLPALIGAVALFALLCGAAAAGSWEAIEERSQALDEEPAPTPLPSPAPAQAHAS